MSLRKKKPGTILRLMKLEFVKWKVDLLCTKCPTDVFFKVLTDTWLLPACITLIPCRLVFHQTDGKPGSKMSSLQVEHVCWTIWEHKWPATKLTRASAWLMPPWYALYSPPVSLDLTHPPQQIWQTRLHYCNVGQHSGQICKFDLQRCCLKLGMTTPQNDQWGCCFGIIKNAHCPYQKVTLLLETHSQLSPDDQNKKWISVTAPVHCNGWTLLVCL